MGRLWLSLLWKKGSLWEDGWFCITIGTFWLSICIPQNHVLQLKNIEQNLLKKQNYTQRHSPFLLFDSVHILSLTLLRPHAANDSHRLPRLTQSLACHGLFTKGSALPSSLHCLGHCPPSAHSVRLGQLHHSLRAGLSEFTGYISATMATTPPCSATLANLITKTHLSACCLVSDA